MRHFDYRPARLVKGKRWYIEYYAEDDSNLLKRNREYFQFPRIKDMHERMKLALSKVAQINDLLPKGYPNFLQKENSDMLLVDAIEFAMKVKSKTDRSKTILTYRSVVNVLNEYLDKKTVYLLNFNTNEAFKFMDWAYVNKAIGASTYNNYRNHLVTIFNVLKTRNYITVNPFSGVETLPATEKERRGLEDDEKRIILNYIRDVNMGLWIAARLIYYCFIRPGELRQMKIGYINFENSTIKLPGDITKNKKTEIITVPTPLLKDIVEYIGVRDSKKYYLIGKNFIPNELLVSGKAYNDKHREYLSHLSKTGELEDIKGITIYSWKDSGALALVNANVNLYDIMRQMRHADLSTTQKYIKALASVNEAILNVKVDF
jgi:integrase